MHKVMITGSNNPPIIVSPYDQEWPKQYAQEASKLKKALKKWLISIHHVGSTAVPGLPAKPKIDIIAEITDMAFDHTCLENLGYTYRGGFSIPLRKSFTLRSHALNVNLHIFNQADPEIELNLLFRDTLKKNQKIRDAYAKLKYELLAQEASHEKQGMYRGYTRSKQDWIHGVLQQAGFKALRCVFAAHPREWDFIHNVCTQEQPTDAAPICGTHKHFILYQGTLIVGYSHIELSLHTSKAALRFLMIKECAPKESKDMLLRCIQTYLKQEGYALSHP